MDLRSTLTRAIGWRWMPCVAPVVGSLSFVVLCVAIVPDDIGPMSASPASAAAARDKKTGAEDTPAEPTDEESEADGKAPGSRAARRLAAPAPAKITTRTTDTVRSLFKGREGLAAEPPGAEPPSVPPRAPGGPAPVVALPGAPPLPPVSNLPAEPDPAADPNPDTALPR